MGHADASIEVTVVYCAAPGKADETVLQLPAGSTLRDAVEASGLLRRHPGIDPAHGAGVWGRRRSPETVLRDRDRVELYRPLTIDPKEARRTRAGR
jgi:hypothetical protein